MREKAELSDPTWADSEVQNFESLAKKHKIKYQYVDTNKNYTTTFKRCGYSYSKRLQSLVVENNAVRSSSVGVERKKKKQLRNEGVNTAKTLNTQLFITSTQQETELKLERPKSGKPLHTNQKMELMKSMLKNPSESAQSMRTIVKILHPYIPENCLSEIYKNVRC